MNIEVGKGSTKSQLEHYKSVYHSSQQWECLCYGKTVWHTFEVGYQPGWFYDSEYRIK